MTNREPRLANFERPADNKMTGWAIWDKFGNAAWSHRYLAQHKLPSLALRQLNEFLVAPVHDLDGSQGECGLLMAMVLKTLGRQTLQISPMSSLDKLAPRTSRTGPLHLFQVLVSL